MSHFPPAFHVHMPCPAEYSHQAIDRWEFEDSALEDFVKLETEAPQAYDFLFAKLRIWAQNGAIGVPTSELKAPVAEKLTVNVKNPPWIGEVKATEDARTKKQKDRHFRLYFGDIKGQENAPPHQMLIGLTSEKIIKGTPFKINSAQNKQMQDAMYKIKQWCIEQQLSYRTRE